MDCAEFESRLTALAGDDVAQAEREPCLRALAHHAAGCDACRGTDSLLEILAEPPGRRLTDAPGDAYWQTFNGRVREQLLVDRTQRKSRATWSVAAAAVLVLALGGTWLWQRSEVQQLAVEGGLDDSMDLPRELVELLERASPADVEDQVEILAGLDSPWSVGLEDGEGPGWDAAVEEPGPFPDMDKLKPEARRELLDWLLEQESARQGVS